MLMRLQMMVAMVLVVLTLSVGAAPSAAVGAATQQQSQARTTTVVAQPAARSERSAPITVLLVGLGAAVGVVVGVLPALVAALALGYLPPPRRWERRAGGMLAEPLPLALEPKRAPAPAPASVALVAAQAEAQDSSGDAPRQGQLAILAHARHQDVYDTAYAQQLERVGALRSAIGDRRRGSPAPPDDRDGTPPAKGTP